MTPQGNVTVTAEEQLIPVGWIRSRWGDIEGVGEEGGEFITVFISEAHAFIVSHFQEYQQSSRNDQGHRPNLIQFNQPNEYNSAPNRPVRLADNPIKPIQ